MLTTPPVVGLLGGSFNPAHSGHVHISKEAMRLLGIHCIWWMVSPQNPLKPSADMADFKTRLAYAQTLASVDKRIYVTDIEQRLGSTHTAKTLKLLGQRYPKTRFIWLMGADNLADLHRWDRWLQLVASCPILVLDRAPLSHQSLRAKAAIRFHKQRVSPLRARLLAEQPGPGWSFAHIKKHPDSATNIRKTLGSDAFLR